MFQQNQENKVRGPCSGSAITYPLNAKGSGRKGGKKRRQRLFHPEKPFEGRDEENASKNPFAQIWHNHNPFPEKPFEGRDEENASKNPFAQIWHNNNPFPEKPFEGRDEENASKNPFAQIWHNNNPFPEKPFEGRDEENTSKNPFAQIWHNNNPLVICSVKSVPLNKKICGYCGTEFSRGPLGIVSFDIVISHKEQWQYLNQKRESEQDPKIPTIPSKLFNNTILLYSTELHLQKIPIF